MLTGAAIVAFLLSPLGQVLLQLGPMVLQDGPAIFRAIEAHDAQWRAQRALMATRNPRQGPQVQWSRGFGWEDWEKPRVRCIKNCTRKVKPRAHR